MQRNVMLAAASVAMAVSAAHLSAATLSWQGSTGNITDANYFDGTNTNVAPAASGDIVRIGNGGTADNTANVSFSRLVVGHAQQSPYNGAGTVNFKGGTVTLGGAAGSDNSGLLIGRNRDGTVNITGGTVSVGRLAVVGFVSGGTGSAVATLDVNTAGNLDVLAGNINLGDGQTGHLKLGAGATIDITGSGADLEVGSRSTSTYTQTGGSFSTIDTAYVGRSTANNSSLSVSGGTFSAREFIVSDGSASGVNVTIGGDAQVETRNGNFSIGLGTSTNTTLNLQGTATLNVNVDGATGGGRFLMGGFNAQQPTGIVMNHSGGTLNTELNVAVADQGGEATYNLSGTGVINATTASVVGRQGTGRFIQTGGVANFNAGVNVGNDENDATALAANGRYEMRDGELHATATGTALGIGTAGTGEFRVYGDEGTVDVNGNLVTSSSAKGTGTLAFQLESGESLSVIDVSGTATFDLGSALVFDLAGVTPTQSVYNLLTATSIVDNGLTFTGPAGWSYQIVGGGNGQVLQVAVPEPSGLALLGAAGLLAMRRGRRRA